VRGVERVDSGYTLRLAETGESFERVVVAVPHHVAPSVLPPGIFEADAARRLGSSPIVNVHLFYDRRVLATTVAAAVDSPLQWLFDRTAAAGLAEGQLVSISLSGASAELDRSRDELVQEATGALPALLPAARGAVLRDSFVTREPRATFRAAPGVAALRPGAKTALPGLALAGAWTDTGWPATMEGAVRSGLAAAAVVLAVPRRGSRSLEEAA
jgi:uncharacterized protein with NAD-binding domain and iron-sulfur cluster